MPPRNEPLLAWARQDVTPDERIHAIASLLRASPVNLSPADFLSSILVSKDSRLKGFKDGFFRSEIAIPYLLKLIVSDERGKAVLNKWLRTQDLAMEIVCDAVGDEMEIVKKCFLLRSKDLEADVVNNFDFDEQITGTLATHAPILRRILLSAAQTSRAATENVMKDPEFTCSVILAQLAQSRSRLALSFQHEMGFLLYSSGASKLAINVLAKCGISTGYGTVHKAHEFLSESLMEEVRKVSRTPHMLGFDNAVFSMSQHVEQRDSAPRKVVSCTAAIIYPLRNASLEACRLGPILARRATCDTITYNKHIRPDSHARAQIHHHLVLDIIDILFHYEPNFQSLQRDCSAEFRHDSYRPPPPGYSTEEFVLRTVEFDESTTSGVISFLEHLYLEQLKMKHEDLEDMAIPCVNDQLTNSRIRSAFTERLFDTTTLHRMENFLVGPGLFHAQMNLLWTIFNIHKGDEDSPGSLSYYIKLLNYHRLGRDRPDYYTLRSFTMDVLTANVLHAWQMVCGFPSLSAFAGSNPSPSILKELAHKVLVDFASDGGLAKSKSRPDSILNNAILLNRDLLYAYEFDRAISSGDFGRVELLLGTLARMFSGAGGKNYASEIMHLIQNLNIAWPEDFANIMRDNLLISVKGHENHFMGVDLNIEHNIGFQKKYFAEKGIHATLKHLEDLSPVTKIYRPLRKKFTAFSGTSWQGSAHSKPSTQSNINKVRSKIEETKIYTCSPGRASEVASVNILQLGGATLKQSGVESFGRRYKEWARASGILDDEVDDLPPNVLKVEPEDL